MKTTALTLVSFLLCACPVAAGNLRWSVDDVIFNESIHDLRVSPDGRWVVWVHNVPDRERNEEVGNLVRLDLHTGRETVLTRGNESSLEPRWSPDGRYLAFLRPRPAGREQTTEETRHQIWLMDPTGGEPWPLTDWPSDILQFDWAGAEALVFTAQETPTLRAGKLKGEKDDTIVVEDERDSPPVRLFRVELSSKKVKRLTENSDRISRLAASPDGRHLVAMHQRSLRYTFDNKVKPAIFLHDLRSGESKQLYTQPHWNIHRVCWTPDSHGFYAVNLHNSQPRFAQAGVFHLHYYDLARSVSIRVDLDWDRGLGDEDETTEMPDLAVTRDGFFALLADGVHHRAARYTRTEDGWRREWLTGEHADRIFELQASSDGKTLLYAYSTASTPTQWYRAAVAGARLEKPRAFAELNPRLRQLPHARTEVIHWKGARGEEVEGILYYPLAYRQGTKCPLVVMIHGGPAAADFDAWEDGWMTPANLVCQRGAFVLKANYHGSTGYGLKWLESITRGRYLDLETIDVEKGVDSLIARGLVDPAKLALSGWSNGAILTNLLTVQTTRYRAAISGAGNVEYVSDWANCEFGDAFNRYYLGSSPVDNPLLYLLKSPFFRLDRVRTPTLILFGSEDQTVPVHQGWVHYRALQQLGKTDVRFVLFPGERHILHKLSHQRRKVKEELTWLDRYLFESREPTRASLPAHSRLAWALKRRQAHREAGRYGVSVKGRLVPETVSFGERRIGRFEVTRAQFAEFDKSYRVEPGRENYPASGITFEQARDYCSWLSKHTGRTYRLPTVEEADELYAHREGSENTLDHWVGHTVNPDDAAGLRRTLKDGEGEALLLKEVGSFRPAGDEAAVFDLGGNVAEWVTSKDGKGTLRGGSADTPADRKQKANRAAPAYRGFRVIEE